VGGACGENGGEEEGVLVTDRNAKAIEAIKKTKAYTIT
jgi:hypothetical protein